MLIDNYKLEKFLGKGAYGEVYLTTKKGDKKLYATKRLIRADIESSEAMKYLRNEILILQKSNH